MANVEKLVSPIGWLIDPHNKWVIHFDFKQVSNDQSNNLFTIDMWGFVPSGKPMEFKSRRKVTEEELINTWRQLIASGWVEFDAEKFKIA